MFTETEIARLQANALASGKAGRHLDYVPVVKLAGAYISARCG
jgi:hypothetical protein